MCHNVLMNDYGLSWQEDSLFGWRQQSCRSIQAYTQEKGGAKTCQCDAHKRTIAFLSLSLFFFLLFLEHLNECLCALCHWRMARRRHLLDDLEHCFAANDIARFDCLVPLKRQHRIHKAKQAEFGAVLVVLEHIGDMRRKGAQQPRARLVICATRVSFFFSRRWGTAHRRPTCRGKASMSRPLPRAEWRACWQ